MNATELKVVTFGEIMMRLSPPDHQRLTQAASFDVIFGGGESNVAVSLAHFGVPAEFVTLLPPNDLGEACLQFLRRFGVGVRHILRRGDRIGIYFLEHGAIHRGSKVVYDRAGSAFSAVEPGMIDWHAAFQGATWFHWTGITPATAPGPAAVCLEGVRAAKEHGLTVSCDLNYRANLWKWGKSAGEVMEEIVGLCDVAIGNEEDAAKVFGIHAAATDVTSGHVEASRYREVCERLATKFSGLHIVAITLRGSRSASHNTWSGVLWREGSFYQGSEYDIEPIVDRVGAGDSFVAGLIFALNAYPGDDQRAVEFAAAASALKHTIPGDFNLVTVPEVERLMGGDRSGRVRR
jgi:2-dehydro-3-deoxygluconokinase